MKEVPVTLAEIGMINSTRFVIGTGVGLVLAEHMDRNTRKAVSISLLVTGILFSIPIGLSFLGKLRGIHAPSPRIPEEHAA
jgi:ABC-type proline/glycine betaine transport system permease subunit